MVDAYNSFDSTIGSIVVDIFTNKRIDSANRVGKNNWAYCWGWPAGKSSFIIVTFNEGLDDIYTLAHENGHAVQARLTYDNQTPLNYNTSSCIGEMCSIFGELLLTDKLFKLAENDIQKKELLAHVLESFFFHVYHIGARTFFEQSVYDLIASGKLLDAANINTLWESAKKRVYGETVEWSDFMEFEWARTPHNFVPVYRFYNYPYSFGQLLAFGLYEEYKKKKDDFARRFKKLLSYGSSRSPCEQLLELGHDISNPTFWELGGKQADRFLEEFRKLI